jgi:phage terminase large subunit
MEIHLSRWQTQVLNDPSRFKVINVGRRSGKTVLSIIKLLIEVQKAKKVVWYVAPTYRQAKSIAWTLLKEYTPEKFSPQWNETELKCSLPNGSEIHLKGADNPDSLRGTKVDLFVFDEVAFYDAWKATWEALRPILVDSQAPAWFVSTPNGFNHFYELYNRQHADPDYKSFHFTSYDNPYVLAEEIDKAKLEMDPQSFAQEFMADFTRPTGTVYQDWNINNYKPFDYDPDLPLHITFDWGVSDPTSVIWIQPGGGEVRIVDYYEASDANIEHFISVINSRPYKKAELYTGDPAGKARTLTTGTSVIELLAKKGIHVRTKDGVRIPEQIRLAHSFMPRLFVNSSNCERFRDCLLNYRYPTKPETAINQENELPIHDTYSHAMRAFEYWCVNWGDTKPKEKPSVSGYTRGMPGTGYGRKPIYSSDLI